MSLIPVADEVLARVLSPYKPEATYLLRAAVDPAARGAASLGGGVSAPLGPTAPLHALSEAIAPAGGFTAPITGPDALVSARGEFAIPFSCYIADTGHFNAVEFNICYNQLAYVLLGQCVISGLLPELEIATFDEYRRRQLPDFLILRLKSSFRQAIDPRAFTGTVSVRSAKRKMSMLMLDTAVRFSDARGGSSEGEVLLGVIDSAKRREQG